MIDGDCRPGTISLIISHIVAGPLGPVLKNYQKQSTAENTTAAMSQGIALGAVTAEDDRLIPPVNGQARAAR